ncbi:DUF1549 and DUF1553 domain-containing protein [Fimbriiglobus ruber]|uniref:DUF1549 domain-containing protein n=1 Tax=Fimbriiglobus ruber TaxID=1908690 RepID=A0A225DPK4_9BACT|nr:DUF1549 and DUF1553 domain-containing protein [Fimbriiglobus ruber]OWK43231.1 hypothetical protein FRUB_02830 [Fimbriiglobus ruber]
MQRVLTFITPLVLLVAVCAIPVRADEPPRYKDPELTPAAKRHWSFVPPVRSPLPAVKDAAWVRTPVDAFVLARLEAAGLKPAPQADKLTLIRRVTFDLTGLPPTPAEIDAFLNDQSPTAYETLVDRLLASPHYGERWAQHWLDVMRYADSNGYEADSDRPQAWRYRDYVVRSFNADKPYDQFVTEQVAGDLLATGKDPREVPDLWVATGIHRCGPVHRVSGNVNSEENRQEAMTEMVNGLGSAVLGLTVGCARCHDHKFDPVSLGDYYRLQAFFAGTFYQDVDLATPEEKAELPKKMLEVSIKLAPIKKQIAEIEAPYHAKVRDAKKARLDPETRAALDADPKVRTAEQKKLVTAAAPSLKFAWDEILAALSPEDRAKRDVLKEQQTALEATLPGLPPQAWSVSEEKSTPPTYVLRRGDVRKKSISVSPAYLRVIVGSTPQPKNRLDLAKWLVSTENTLTARVIVNRLWQHHFGRGIVATPNDYGTRGESPTHPELLDWLAKELVEPTWGIKPGVDRPWAMKRIHRLMVTSATYRQAGRVTPSAEATKVDPGNKLLWRANRQRLDAESTRDAMLVAAGTLTRDVGGASVKVPLEPEVYDLIFTEGEPTGLWPVTTDPKQHTRRSLYLFVKRNVRLPNLEAFDQPDTLNSCAVRSVSTFAPQALILMNGPFAQEQSKAMAAELYRSAGPSPDVQLTALYRRALGRPPRDDERQAGLVFLKEQAALIRPRLLARLPVGIPQDLPVGTDPAAARALADLCLVLFNTNEFVYVP